MSEFTICEELNGVIVPFGFFQDYIQDYNTAQTAMRYVKRGFIRGGKK